MSSNPLVSVVIVTYKPNLDYISQAIDSVKRQTYKNIEIIIVNDKSTYEVEKYFDNLVHKDKNIIYVCNEIKKGVATARNQ
jgi:glycosyltransferase involved in cell wall biosynthesis